MLLSEKVHIQKITVIKTLFNRLPSRLFSPISLNSKKPWVAQADLHNPPFLKHLIFFHPSNLLMLCID